MVTAPHSLLTGPASCTNSAVHRGDPQCVGSPRDRRAQPVSVQPSSKAMVTCRDPGTKASRCPAWAPKSQACRTQGMPIARPTPSSSSPQPCASSSPPHASQQPHHPPRSKAQTLEPPSPPTHIQPPGSAGSSFRFHYAPHSHLGRAPHPSVTMDVHSSTAGLPASVLSSGVFPAARMNLSTPRSDTPFPEHSPPQPWTQNPTGLPAHSGKIQSPQAPPDLVLSPLWCPCFTLFPIPQASCLLLAPSRHAPTTSGSSLWLFPLLRHCSLRCLPPSQ